MITINAQKCRCGNSNPGEFLEDHERGEFICRNCGTVTQLVIEPGAAIHAEEPLGSIMDPAFAGGKNEFTASLRRVANRVIPDYQEFKWRELIEEIGVRSAIPEPVRESVIQYYQINQTKFRHMRKRELATALLYVHMKNSVQQHRSLKEISADASAELRKARHYVAFIGFENGLKPVYRPPEEYVSVYGTRMSLPHDVVARGSELAREYRESAFSSVTPRTMAACALYLACRQNGHEYTQREIANAFGIAEYTVREVSIKMRKFLGGD